MPAEASKLSAGRPRSTSRESVIVAPAERKAAVVEVFESAQRSLSVGMFRWEDEELLGGLERARRRGARVRVLLSQRAKGWGKRLDILEHWLEGLGVEVRRYQTKASKYHAKYAVADGRLALVGSFNFTARDFTRTCDFALLGDEPEFARGLAKLFEADWEGRAAEALPPRLLVTPGDGRARIRALIEAARQSIDIVDHRLWSPDMLDLLGRRAAAGVRVRVIGPVHAATSHALALRELRGGLAPHGKLMIADNHTAVIGSISPLTPLLDHRRELSAATTHPASLAALSAFFNSAFA